MSDVCFRSEIDKIIYFKNKYTINVEESEMLPSATNVISGI